VTDIFREVEEDVRRERFEKLWKQYGDYVIALAALLVIGAAGYQLWRYYEARERAKASDEYTAAQQLIDARQSVQAAAIFAKLAKDAPGGYAEVSQLQQADALLAAGKKDDAVALYKKIAGGSDELLAAVARIRTAWAIVETTPRLELETLLAPLTDPTSPWRPMAREILAYSDYHMGATKEALAAYAGLAADKDAPMGVRQRSDAMATFLRGGGDNDYGTLPKAPAQPAPAAHH
jgi:hypothetical protein